MRRGASGGSKDAVDWPDLLALIEDDDRRAAVEHVYPKSYRQSFLGTLRDIAPPIAQQLMASGRKVDTVAKLGDWPTIAVAGMLNGGKTSLVSTFLSPQGRRRTLRGSSNAAGTHRFVLWLPSQWQTKTDLWDLLLQRIADAVGGSVEMLADTPQEAHRQYNNADGDESVLRVPLIATDAALDDLGVGLLDCPDIVSDEAFGLGSPRQRRELLGKAATLCSAFLVVASAESSRDSTLGDLMRIASDLMPGVPRLLAVNKVRPRQSPDEVFEAFSPLAKTHGVETIYAAYDFEIPGWEKYNPDPGHSVDADDPMPVFFSVSPQADRNPPAEITADRLLKSLPQRLDRARLFESFQRALQVSLRNVIWHRGFTAVEQRTSQSRDETRDARDCLLDAAMEFFVQRDFGEAVDLRLVQNKRVVRQLSESFIATAPWYARWGVQLNAKIRNVLGGVSSFGKRFSPTAMAGEAGESVRQKFRDGELDVLSPSRLATAIDRHGGDARLPHWPALSEQEGQNLYREAAEAAILRFERDGATALDPRRLDELTAKMWAEISTGQKLKAGLTPLAAATAAFGAVLLVPVDFGASAVGLASIPELFGALGLTVFAQNWAGKQNLRNVELQAAKQQLSDFSSVLCDVFGVQRWSTPPSIRINGVSQRLSEAKIVQREPFDQNRVLALVHLRDDFVSELKRMVPPAEASSSPENVEPTTVIDS